VRRLALLVLALTSVTPTFAAIVSEHPDDVTLAIYETDDTTTAGRADPRDAYVWQRNGMAFITETRKIDLPAGSSVIEFRGVMSTIVPQTAEVDGLPAGVLERNFDYNLLSPASILAKSIGQTVDMVRTDPDSGRLTDRTAIVRSGPSGVMLEIGGTLEALHCSGLAEKLVFKKVPDGLRDTPTLSVRAMMAEAGRYTVTLSYIATGLHWSADYNARIRPGGRSLDLSGWITLANYSETGYKQIPVELVAGRTYTTDEDHPISTDTPQPTDDCWQTNIKWVEPIPQFSPLYWRLHGGRMEDVQSVPIVVTALSEQEMKIEPSRLGDYKLYLLPEATNVASHQMKQVQFLDQPGVPFERLYTYAVTPDMHTSEATSVIRLHNTKAAGLGNPLPAGTVSVMESAPDGSPVLAGQHVVRDTPTGLPLEIEIGRAIGIRIEQHKTDTTTTGYGKDKLTRAAYEIVIENDKNDPIRFELVQPILDGARLVAEDEPHSIDPKGMVWSLAMAPGERKAMHFTIEQPVS
jgi:hypothetical protein